MIKTFRSTETELLWSVEFSRQIPGTIHKSAFRKLQLLNAAVILTDLLVPPGNRLEALKGDRRGQHSIRINDQYRICFEWRDGNAYEVEITDYH